MELWILLTLLGAAIQNARSVLQKNLVGRLSVLGAAYARFLYSAPLSWLMVLGAVTAAGAAWPTPSPTFFAMAFVGAIAQMLGNTLYVHLIRASNFTVITTYIKTETVIGALLSFIALGDRLSPLGLAGVIITLFGVMVLSAGRGTVTVRTLITSLGAREAIYGVGVGGLYAIASTAYRGAALELGTGGVAVPAFYTLAWVSLFQAVVMGAWLLWKAPEAFRETLRAWRVTVWVGVGGVAASACWYSAFTLQVTAYVLAVGQAELILAYLVSHFLFKERTRAAEIAGILITVVGILAVVAGD